MALADFKAASHKFEVNGTPFIVKGLSFASLSRLIKHHLADAEAVYDLVVATMGGETEFTEEVFNKILVALLEQAPTFTANLIALAANEDNPEAIAAAESLDFIVQMQVLTVISDLTFREVGGIKKGLGIIVGLLKQTKGQLPGLVSSIRS